ncbi:MAG: class I SAM-dependent methyltransferase [Flavisolibacter sp.]|nr:class I SAM-dependent methyltransferase [Flavisolibacter sp.]
MELLKQIFREKKVYDANGTAYDLVAHTSQEQCHFLQKIILDIKPETGLEVGLAYGISTLAILEAFSQLGSDFKHIVLDPYQKAWNNIGLENITKSGFTEKVVYYNDFSDKILPKLYLEGTKIQFAYIDSTKVFDVLMVDTYYILKMLQLGGVLVFDDVDFPGIRRLLRYLVQHPSFKIYGTLKKERPSLKKKIAQVFYKYAIAILPFKDKLIPNIDYRTDADLNIDYHCIALQKVSEDNRHWDWHINF